MDSSNYKRSRQQHVNALAGFISRPQVAIKSATLKVSLSLYKFKSVQKERTCEYIELKNNPC